MFWADRLSQEIQEKYKGNTKAKKPLIIRDEKTASGRIHVGSLRGVAIHGIVSEVLSEAGISNTYLYEINDFDPMDGLPGYLDQEKFKPYMGQPLCTIPSPDGKAKNYAEYFAEEFISVINKIGFKPEYYRLSDKYKEGLFNNCIREAILNAKTINKIYKEVSGSTKDEDWLPIQMICEKCGKVSTTVAKSFDGNEVEYVCEENAVTWTKGCGHAGKRSPYDGNAKLPWKVEWAAKFVVFGVDIEGAGKDHSTKGGSREIADEICRTIFKHEPPFNIPYEFIQVGGKKMSSSKGAGASSYEVSELIPPELVRLLLLGKDPKRVIDFIPDGDTIPILYDNYDKFADEYFRDVDGDFKRIFFLVHAPEIRNDIHERFLPRFSQIAFLVQMPHMDISLEVEKIKGSPLTDLDKKEIEYRSQYARHWLKAYAPEDYKYELKETLPEVGKNLSGEQKSALKLVLDYVKSKDILDGQELHTKVHDLRKESNITPQEFFSAIYLIFLGKPNGPKVGWFLSVLDKQFLERRLEEVTR